MPGVLGGCGEGGQGEFFTSVGGDFLCYLAWGVVWGGYFFKFMSEKKKKVKFSIKAFFVCSFCKHLMVIG